MKPPRPRMVQEALLPLVCAMLLLPLLAIAGMALIGERGLPGTSPATSATDPGLAVLPGMGATILPRWNLGNFDPRLEGADRGAEWPVPAAISCAADRSSTLTNFSRRPGAEPLPRLIRAAGQGEKP